MTITVIGTGYVGLVTGVCLADAGFTVACVDTDKEKIRLLKSREVPFYEPGLKELLKKNKEQLTFVSSLSAVNGQESSVIIICVGTPPLEDGSPDMTAYWKVIGEIQNNFVPSPSIKRGPGGVLVVNKSTVPVGTARKAQEKLGNGYSIVSMPEFLREGKAVSDFKNPDRVIIGSESGKSSDVLDKVCSIWSCPVVLMQWESSELTKYTANAFLATKISFINEIARVCEEVGADVDDIATGIGLDSRIGKEFLRAGIGYGGSCFPKDVRALSSLAGKHDYTFQLLKATIEVNNTQREFVLNKILNCVETGLTPSLQKSTISVLGLAFKGNTDDVRESPALWLVQKLLEKGAIVKGYDPQAINNTLETLQCNVSDKTYQRYVSTVSPEECVQDVDCVVLATEWEEFKDLDWKKLALRTNMPVLIDAKNLLNKNEIEKNGWRYYGVGR